jgi:hypothetical protein
MQVRATCNHYNGTYRKEGDEFEHVGDLYEHIEPVEQPENELPSKPKGKTKGKQVD